MKATRKPLIKAIADFKAYIGQPATSVDLFTALGTMAGGGFAILGVLAAVLAYFNASPHPH